MNATAALGAVCCAALALWAGCGPTAGVVRLRAVSASAGRGPGNGPRRGRRRWRSEALGLVAAVLCLFRAPGDRRRATALWRASVIALCDALGAELRAGHPPEAAFGGAVAVLDPAVASALLGDRVASGDRVPAHGDPVHGDPVQADQMRRDQMRRDQTQSGRPQDGWGRIGQVGGGRTRAGPDGGPLGEGVPELLERAAQRPGGEGLRLLAACWRIGAERGGAFALVVDGLAGSLRQDQEQRQEIAAQLAGPRATARLLAGLPVLGLLMASALGARPLSFLLGTLPGALCLAGGVGLDLAGLLWTRRLAARVEPGARPRPPRPLRRPVPRWGR